MTLQKKEKDFFFSKKIDKKDEDLFIMRYEVLTKKIKGLTESYIVNLKRLKELLLINDGKSFCKFYFLEENNALNIGLSFSDNDESPIIDKEDILYVLNNELFIETDFTNFSSLVNAFGTGISTQLMQHTTFTTALISYPFETVDTYITALEFYFTVNQLKFNMIQFRSTDLNNNPIACSQGRHDRISFSVHALIDNLENKILPGESDGSDLGNLRP